jgi:hypothetical protein
MNQLTLIEKIKLKSEQISLKVNDYIRELSEDNIKSQTVLTTSVFAGLTAVGEIVANNTAESDLPVLSAFAGIALIAFSKAYDKIMLENDSKKYHQGIIPEYKIEEIFKNHEGYLKCMSLSGVQEYVRRDKVLKSVAENKFNQNFAYIVGENGNIEGTFENIKTIVSIPYLDKGISQMVSPSNPYADYKSLLYEVFKESKSSQIMSKIKASIKTLREREGNIDPFTPPSKKMF